MTKKFVLVVGSGIHKQFRPTKADDPLATWGGLLDAVRRKAKISSAPHRGALPPSIEWEQLVADFAAKCRTRSMQKKLQSHQAENRLKAFVKDVLTKQIGAISVDDVNDEVRQVVQADSVAEIISLNFEASWHPTAKKFLARNLVPARRDSSALSYAAKQQLYRHVETESDQRIWFPNGHYKAAYSLRLGLRDFGLQPMAIYEAYRAYKSWQRAALDRKSSKGKQSPISRKDFLKLRQIWEGARKSGAIHPADTWVTAFMLYTPVFVGASIGRDEQGIWWLLCQRERDVSRASDVQKPIFLNAGGQLQVTDSNPWDAARIYGESVPQTNFSAAWRELARKLAAG